MFNQLLKLMKSLGTPLAIRKGDNAGKGFFIVDVRYNSDNFKALQAFVSDKCADLSVSHKAEVTEQNISVDEHGTPIMVTNVKSKEIIFVSPIKANEYNDLEAVEINFS